MVAGQKNSDTLYTVTLSVIGDFGTFIGALTTHLDVLPSSGTRNPYKLYSVVKVTNQAFKGYISNTKPNGYLKMRNN